MPERHLRPIRSEAATTGEGEDLLTIEALAASTGMTVRNIRSHRTSGLLPAPIVRDRVGYYGPEHVARLALIQELQAEGFNLKGIKRLIEQPRLSPADMLNIKHVLDTPHAFEDPRVFTLTDLAALFAGGVSAEDLAEAVSLGLLTRLTDDQFEAPIPSLLDSAQEVVARGVPLRHALRVIAKVQEQCQAIGREFVGLFLDDVWKPFAARDYPEENWNDIVEAIQRLRPLSSQVVLAVYEHRMAAEVEGAFGRELARLARSRGS